jgi:protein-tyrosine phosphatase
MTRVLFVCMGNICRSPTAQAVFRHAVKATSLGHVIECDSAGTHAYHIGEAPDRRSQRAAASRGYDMSALRGRQVSSRDFAEFDHVLAMDRQNLAALARLCPPAYAGKLALFCDFDEQYSGQDVPDPYYGDARDFERVLDLCEQVSAKLIVYFRQSVRA